MLLLRDFCKGLQFSMFYYWKNDIQKKQYGIWEKQIEIISMISTITTFASPEWMKTSNKLFTSSLRFLESILRRFSLSFRPDYDTIRVIYGKINLWTIVRTCWTCQQTASPSSDPCECLRVVTSYLRIWAINVCLWLTTIWRSVRTR